MRERNTERERDREEGGGKQRKPETDTDREIGTRSQRGTVWMSDFIKQERNGPGEQEREGKEIWREPVLCTPLAQEGSPPSEQPLIPSPESLNPLSLRALSICHCAVLNRQRLEQVMRAGAGP